MPQIFPIKELKNTSNISDMCYKSEERILQPYDMVRQVVSTMAIEDMHFSKDFIEKMLKVAKGELSSEEVRQEVIREYGRQ
ncbi:MAG: antitoxin VbhA family protein [Clostridium sp.]|nr:antitoxin VbhA family protein [Clostridium sp.]